MANPIHIERLDQGRENWNHWIRSHPDVHPDLSDTDLSHRDLRADLREANFSNARLEDAGLLGANVRGAIHQGTALERVTRTG